MSKKYEVVIAEQTIKKGAVTTRPWKYKIQNSDSGNVLVARERIAYREEAIGLAMKTIEQLARNETGTLHAHRKATLTVEFSGWKM